MGGTSSKKAVRNNLKMLVILDRNGAEDLIVSTTSQDFARLRSRYHMDR